MDSHTLAKLAPYLVPLLVVAIVARRLIKNTPRKVRPSRLFITPVLLLFATVTTVNQTGLPSPLWASIDLLAAALGVGAGYLSARHREFTFDVDSGEIMGRATPIGTIIFAALFAIRFGLKLVFPQLNGNQTYSPSALSAHPAANVIGWTDAGLVFSTAMLLAIAATTWLRTQHLMAMQRERKQVAADGTKPAITDS